MPFTLLPLCNSYCEERVEMMSGFKISFSIEKDRCIAVGKGKVTLNQCLHAMNDIVNNELYSPKKKVFVDLTQINYHPSYDELNSIKDHILFLKKSFKNKIGITITPKLLPIALLFETLVRPQKINIKFFTSLEKAEKWLEE